MIPPTIAEVAGQELIWVQPMLSRPDYELRAAAIVVASLRGHRGESANRSWTFKREGRLRRRVTVHAADSDLTAAVFRWRRAEGGTMELPEGRILHFGAAQGTSSLRCDWLEPDGKPLVHFQTRAGFDMSEALVEIEHDAAQLPELPLLVVLGEYLTVLFAARRGDVPNVWSVWDTIPFTWPDFDLPSLPDLPDLPDFD